MYYLGLDLSLTGSGIVLLDKDCKVEFAITLKNKLVGMERLQYIRNEIATMVDDAEPNCICIENYAMGSHAGQAFSIGELGGVIKLMLWEKGQEPYLITPTRLKKYITGKGVAEKDQIMLSIYKNFGWEPKDNNQADAYGLAHMAYMLSFGNQETLKAFQKEVIHDTLYPNESKPKKKESKMKRMFPNA